MLSHGVEFGKYGVQTTFYFSFEDATVVDAPFTGVAPLAADIFLSKDGGAPANATNAMTAIGNGIYSWVATATEMQATRLVVSVYDQTATEIFKPAYMIILTKLQLGQIDVAATAIGGNTPAMVLQGVGSSHGLQTTGGATGHGIAAAGGATSGNGIDARAQADSVGIKAYSNAGTSGIGFQALGRGDGAGIQAQGGATDAYGVEFLGQGDGAGLLVEGGASDSHGIEVTSQGTGHGIFVTAAGTGDGIYARATGGTAAGLRADGGSGGGHGAHFVGGGAADGLRAQAGSSGYGFFGVGAGGGSAANFGGVGPSLSWDDLEGTEPSSVAPDNASFRQIMQVLKRYVLNRATETAIERKVFKDDSSTVLLTQQVNDDEVTQTRGKAT